MIAQLDLEYIKTRPIKALSRLLMWAFFEGRPLTTRARWLNQLVFQFYRMSSSIPIMEGATRPIYIVGTGRSGTTLLGRILGMHRDVVFLNEPKALWHHGIGGEDIIGSYDPKPGLIRLHSSGFQAESRRKIAHAYSFAMRLGRSVRVADKYPDLLFRIPIVQELFPNARFVAIVRDGVDTCSSVVGWSRKYGRAVRGEVHDWWGRNDQKWHTIVRELVPENDDLSSIVRELEATKDHQDRAAVEWIVSMREARAAARSHSEVLMIRYEELFINSDTVISAVLRHCGLNQDAMVGMYAEKILKRPDKRMSVRLMPALAPIFCAELAEMGYEESIPRVQMRS